MFACGVRKKGVYGHGITAHCNMLKVAEMGTISVLSTGLYMCIEVYYYTLES